MIIMILILILHAILCVVAYVLMRMSVLKCTRAVMPIVCLIPVWGFAAMVILELRARDDKKNRVEVGIEKLKVNDAVHKSLLLEESAVEDRVVPLEEALLINDAATRRQLMMEVLYADPEDYVEQLKTARMNEDTEVVHYAVTALTELQKEYELQFQELERQRKEDPENEEVTERYLDVLKRYLESGIAEGNERKIKLTIYSSLLEEQIRRYPEELDLREEKARADLDTGAYAAAKREIRQILDHWNRSETGYLLMLQYYSAVWDRRGIDGVLEEIQRKNIHLTPRGRRMTGFWKKEEGRRQV